MIYIDLNRSGVNAKLLDSALSRADREFIHSQVSYMGTRSIFVRAIDTPRLRRLLDVPESIERRTAARA